MRSLTVITLLSLAATVTPCRTAAAGNWPRPETSSVSAPLIACPAGDRVFTVVARDVLSNPVAGSTIMVWFETCASVRIPPVLGDEGYTVSFLPDGVSVLWLARSADLLGRADFTIRAGGLCPAASVKVYGDGMLIASRALASPDQDGNLGVGLEDVALAGGRLGAADPTADFDGDGVVTAADLDILRGHLGHHAPGMATPAVPRSWGTIKLLYR